QALDLLGAPARTALVHFPYRSLVGRRGQHRVFTRDPPLARPAEPPGRIVGHRRGAQHTRLAHREQDRTGRPLLVAELVGDGSKRRRVPAVGTRHAPTSITMSGTATSIEPA